MERNHQCRQWRGGLLALLACTVAWPVAAQQTRLSEFSAPPQWRVVSAQRLDQIRGGFDMPALKLRLSFGLEQSVLVNGELVARTVLNIEQLRQAVATQIEATRTSVLDTTAGLNAQIQAQVAEQLRAVGLRTTTINATSSQAQAEAAQALAALPAATPATPAEATVDQGVVSQPMVAANEGAGSGAVVTPVQVLSPDAQAPVTTPVTVVQNGSGNMVSSASVVGNDALTTVIQNSLDNQRIQVLTEVSASANSLQILRAMNMGATIREGVINSLRR
ncbi:MAG: hypothetical protein H6944_13085 [Zoogloeaceae bacterium]|nr:hypothetical protein [Rhodocyclaceae bacterium]MCP5222613.1 hypothetical protein [Zoogloeaceae bacterium]